MLVETIIFIVLIALCFAVYIRFFEQFKDHAPETNAISPVIITTAPTSEMME